MRIVSTDAATASAEEDVAFAYAYEALDWHFTGTPASALVTVLRQFPLHIRRPGRVGQVVLVTPRLLRSSRRVKEDADILFVLTTNRPQELESALAGRPGRVDQAIEVPLPDDVDRGKLVQLYGGGLPLDAAVIADTVRRTEGVSAAFIKELMRRIAQSAMARDGGKSVTSGDIDEALSDMLFAGDRLNVKLLGGAQEVAA